MTMLLSGELVLEGWTIYKVNRTLRCVADIQAASIAYDAEELRSVWW